MLWFWKPFSAYSIEIFCRLIARHGRGMGALRCTVFGIIKRYSKIKRFVCFCRSFIAMSDVPLSPPDCIVPAAMRALISPVATLVYHGSFDNPGKAPLSPSSMNSIMSPTSHFSAPHMRSRTSVFTFPPFPSFATEVALMPLISRSVFLLIPRSIRSLKSLL